jgi:1,4-alpha-glucan branching enzyme
MSMPLQDGMGAIVHTKGCTVRVWAPHAKSVKVRVKSGGMGRGKLTALNHETDGFWAADLPGVKAGDHYKFVLDTPAGMRERIDPYAMQVTSSVGEGIVFDHAAFDWQDDAFELPPHNELVIYELHVGSFLSKDGKTGTLDTALEHLGHLQRLGINVIQIMPVKEFAGDLSWGYNPAHIFAVESVYGGPDALKNFVRECHKVGIAVILDVVYNHFGPSDLDLWQFDGASDNDKGGIYFYQDERSNTPWGDTRPDYGRKEVRQFIRDNVMMWLTDYRMDGLRFDMTLYIRSIAGSGDDDIPEGWSLLQWVNEEIRTIDKRRISIAEDLRTVDALTNPVLIGGAGFNAQWDANFVHPVREVVITGSDEARSMDAVRDAVAFKYGDDAFRRVIYSESHDEVANGRARIPHEIDPDDNKGWFAQKRSTLAAGLVFTAPGIPMLFQGQEFLQGEWFRDDVPLDWHLRDEFRGIVRLYADLAKLRLNRSGATRGLAGQHVDVHHVNDEMNMISFHRWAEGGPGDDVVVVMNFANAARNNYRIGFPSGGHWLLRLNSDSEVYSQDFANGHATSVNAEGGEYSGKPASAEISVAPYSFLIFSKNP